MSRTYENVCVLRAVTTSDFMTADWYDMPKDVLATISSRIINEVTLSVDLLRLTIHPKTVQTEIIFVSDVLADADTYQRQKQNDFLLASRKQVFKRWGYKQIRGHLRKKGSLLFSCVFRISQVRPPERAKKQKKGEKGRNRDFREGRPDTH